MIRRAQLWAGAAVLAAGIALCGCGSSGGGDDSPSGPPLTKAEWVSKANAICESTRKQGAALGDPDSPEGVAQIVDDVKRVAQKEVDELRSLNAPQSVRVNFERMVDEMARMVDLMDDLKATAQTGDEKKLRAFIRGEFDQHDNRALEIADEIGLEECDE